MLALAEKEEYSRGFSIFTANRSTAGRGRTATGYPRRAASRAATSQAVSVFWVAPAPGIFVADGSGDSSLTSTTTGGTCASLTPSGKRCEDGSGPGEVFSDASASAQLELPSKWMVKLLFRGQLVCMTSELSGTCDGVVTVPPDIGAAAVYPLTAGLISPQGTTTVATLNVTVFS